MYTAVLQSLSAYIALAMICKYVVNTGICNLMLNLNWIEQKYLCQWWNNTIYEISLLKKELTHLLCIIITRKEIYNQKAPSYNFISIISKMPFSLQIHAQRRAKKDGAFPYKSVTGLVLCSTVRMLCTRYMRTTPYMFSQPIAFWEHITHLYAPASKWIVPKGVPRRVRPFQGTWKLSFRA